MKRMAAARTCDLGSFTANLKVLSITSVSKVSLKVESAAKDSKANNLTPQNLSFKALTKKSSFVLLGVVSESRCSKASYLSIIFLLFSNCVSHSMVDFLSTFSHNKILSASIFTHSGSPLANNLKVSHLLVIQTRERFGFPPEYTSISIGKR